MPASSDNRKKRVFRAVVREYVESAEPVGSHTIVVKYRLGVSPATIRNDMADLEAEGLLEQPHISAGRVPTEKGYRFYVEQFVDPASAQPTGRQRLLEAFAELDKSAERVAKELARAAAELADETVLVSFGPDRTYLSGVSNLFNKPESRESEMPAAMSHVIDDMDRVMDDLRRRMSSDVEVLIGEENPFGSLFSSVVTRLNGPDADDGIFGILGPKRMDYDANVALARFIREMMSGR